MMKENPLRTSAIALGIAAALASGSASAWETTLLDTNTPAREQTITSKQLGIKAASPFSIKVQLLHGGRQEGVMLVEIDTGAMKITVVPPRGMNVLQAVAGDVRLGWHSPVKEVVNPSFIELTGMRAGSMASCDMANSCIRSKNVTRCPWCPSRARPRRSRP